MKTKHLLAIAACMAAIAMAATSCNNDELPDNNNPGNQTATDNATFTITASTPAEKPTTRLEYTEGVFGTSGLEVKWAKGEEVFYALIDDKDSRQGIKGVKNQTSEASKTATFTVLDIDGGNIACQDCSLYALYPAKDSYKRDFMNISTPFVTTLPLTGQSGKLSDMQNFDYMTAQAIITDNSSEVPDLSFKRRVAILRLSGLTFQGATGGDATISISGTGLKTEGTLAINENATPTVKPNGQDGTITTTGTFTIGSDGKLTENVYICFFPPKAGGISNLKITAKVGSNSYEYSYAGAVGTATDPFKEGCMYTLSDAEMMKSKIVYNYTLSEQTSVPGKKPDLATPGQPNSESNPYLIATIEELQWVKKNPAETNYYKLMKDVEIVDQNGAANWVPIGDANNFFQGRFDGNNMKVIGSIVADNMPAFGFFGAGDGVEIKNLHMEASMDVSAINYAQAGIGGIIGAIQNGNIEHCTNVAYLSNDSNQPLAIGGIAGLFASGRITACVNTGNINAASQTVGGICGFSPDATIVGCINKGSIKANDASIGGIVGMTEETAEVTACWNNATKIINEKGTITGAIVGNDQGNTTYSGCYWKYEAGLEGVGSGKGILNQSINGTFKGDFPSRIDIMNESWENQDSSRKYQFNSTTGEIEPIP